MDLEKYQTWYRRSISDPEGFWAEQAKTLISWMRPWKSVLTGSLANADVTWFNEAQLNVCYNCLDRHLEQRGDQTAIIWQGDDIAATRRITYTELHQEVCRFANVLTKLNVKKGDRVCIYMPMVPEVAVAMLACARIGAIHVVVFGGFSAESLKSRILDTDSELVITANESIRGGKVIPLKKQVDEALQSCPKVRKVVVLQHTDQQVAWNSARDVWYHDGMQSVNDQSSAVSMDANDPLFILYTSGSTGKPKGIVHVNGGYSVYAAMTFKYIFDYHEKEIYWCTADVGWITGHTYGVYGPLLNGATILMFEGIPNYPTPARFWQIVDQYQVNIFYTAPTAIRALRREGDAWVKQTQRKSLRLLGTVGEPINPEAWQWYFEVVGDKRCPIVDTWWQTETGGIMISPLPGITPLKPGSASWPFFGVVPKIVDDHGKAVADNAMGNLLIAQPWPGMTHGIYGDADRFKQAYLSTFPGNYATGDQAHRDEEGYYWIAGRSDDVIKVSGHRIGTEEVESALLLHHVVAEAAVVGIADDIKGQSIYAFVVLLGGHQPSEAVKNELIQMVRDQIGAIAAPSYIQWANELPKTRSGKIMRRILRKIVEGESESLGDLSTLTNPDVVDELIKERAKCAE